MAHRQQHFLIVAFPAQGHINPALHLAGRLASTTSAHVTFSTTISAHRRMFPGLSEPDEKVEDGLVSYVPYSDGYDNGFKANNSTDYSKHFVPKAKLVGSKTLSTIFDNLAASDRPVTCIIYTMLLLSWVADVAHDHGIPCANYWIQSATVFAIYYHYFHGYDELISSHSQDPLFTVNLSGLPPLQVRDLPSFTNITDSDDPFYWILLDFKECFNLLDQKERSSKPRVMINTVEALEADAIKAIGNMELITIGPQLPSLSLLGTDSKYNDLVKEDNKGYMEWLDSKPERSVVYVSFGSISVIKKQQLEEILRGLRESGRPYLLVVKKDGREELVELEEGENGMVVEWCSQVKVLSHPSIGCFVTHCGWNSILESLVCGVPIVGVPQRSDQGTIMKLVEMWGMGMRSEANKEGVLEGRELTRCLEVVMGEGERGVEIRKCAGIWRDKVREAISEGGSSDVNLKACLEKISSNDGDLSMSPQMPK